MWRIAVLTLSISFAAFAAAPQLTSIDPRGAQRGKSITLTLVGEHLTEGATVLSSLPGTFTPLTPPESMSRGQKLPFLVELKPDAAVGAYPIRVQTAEGISNILLFTVGAFPEVIVEGEFRQPSREHANDSIQSAEPITAPVTVNGALNGAGRDYYRVPAKRGERLVFEVEARRVGSALDPVLTVFDSAGRQIARNDDAVGLGVDSRVDITFPSDGDYFVMVQDARFSKQKQNFYRLNVANFEYAEAIFPLGGRRGTKLDVEFSGGSLKAPRKAPVDLSQLSAKQNFTRVNLAGEASLPFLFAVDDLPEKMEPERRDATEAVMLEPSTVMNGQISKAGEVDRFRLAVSPGNHWELELTARGLGTSRLDGVVTVYDAKGRKLSSAGDKAPKQDVFSLLSAGRTSSDPWLEFEAPPDAQEVVIAVEDLLQRGGPGFGYRLVARQQPVDFELTVLEPYVNIPARGSASVNVSVARHGFIWPIELSIPELGNDYTVEGGHLPAEWKEDAYSISRRGILTITAKPDAKPKKLVELAVWGTGKTPDGSVVRRKARCLGMITEIAGGTGISDAEDRENQSPFVAPWLGLDLPVMLARSESGAIEPDAPRVLRLVQGSGFELKWNFKPRNPDAQPPENIGVDVAAPSAAEIGVRRSKLMQKEEKYAGKGEFDVFTTTHTAPEKYDLVMFAESKNEQKEALTTPAITLEVVQGYRVTAPKEALTLHPGEKKDVVGDFYREPEFTQPVTVQAEYLPAHVTCQPAELRGPSKEYRLACEADASAKAGEYTFQLTPASVVVGLDKREVPYKIAPVAAKLIVAGNEITQKAR